MPRKIDLQAALLLGEHIADNDLCLDPVRELQRDGNIFSPALRHTLRAFVDHAGRRRWASEQIDAEGDVVRSVVPEWRDVRPEWSPVAAGRTDELDRTER